MCYCSDEARSNRQGRTIARTAAWISRTARGSPHQEGGRTPRSSSSPLHKMNVRVVPRAASRALPCILAGPSRGSVNRSDAAFLGVPGVISRMPRTLTRGRRRPADRSAVAAIASLRDLTESCSLFPVSERSHRLDVTHTRRRTVCTSAPAGTTLSRDFRRGSRRRGYGDRRASSAAVTQRRELRCCVASP